MPQPRRTLLAALAVLALAAAGCSDKAAIPAGIPTDGDGEALPTVHGVVVDEAIRPLEGAQVRVLGTDILTYTDEDGRYQILRPTFTAESVLLAAVLQGYQPLTHEVQLSGHRSMAMDFRLQVDPFMVPHLEVYNQRGVLPCRATGPVPPGAVACEPPRFSIDKGIVPPPTTFEWPLDTGINLAGAVLQVHWEAETDLARELRATLRGPVVGCCVDGEGGSMGDIHAEVTGPSPLRLELPEAAARGFPAWSALWLEVGLPDGGDQPAFTRAQTVDAFATLFYVDPAPPGYVLT